MATNKSTSPLVRAQGLTRRYGARQAVRGIDLELARGEILGLLGPNGAGKSTSLRLLTGNLAPHSGTVQINGMDLHSHPKAAKHHLGYLPEIPPLYPELSVDEYLDFAARIHGLTGKALCPAVEKAKARCGLETTGKRLIGNLSKGYQQRVGIAQAIVHQPEVIILDEPTVGLDPNQIREIRQLIRELGEAHSVILSSHILPEVQSLCSRVQIIHQGQTLYNGSPIPQEESTALLVAFERAPELETLAKIPGIDHCQTQEDGYFQLALTAEISPTFLIQELANCDWGLCEVRPQRQTLEQLFVELTSGEAA